MSPGWHANTNTCSLTCMVYTVAQSSLELVCMHGMMMNCQWGDSILSGSETKSINNINNTVTFNDLYPRAPNDDCQTHKSVYKQMHIMQTSTFGFGHSRRLMGAESTADSIAKYELKLFNRRRCCIQSTQNTRIIYANKSLHVSMLAWCLRFANISFNCIMFISLCKCCQCWCRQTH